MDSVAICTWNRAELLEGAIRSLLDQDANGIDHEILVIDNGSTDGTRDLVESMARADARVRHVTEPKLGLNHARNRALAEARGTTVCFLDDDARAHARWLHALHETFATSPDVAAAGGPVRLRWSRPPPHWFPVGGSVYLGELDLGAQARALTSEETPRGLNMAVRTETARRAGGFAPTLDRRGRSLATGGDDEFLLRLHRRGHRLQWVPDASVEHLVDAERLSRRWLLRRAFMQGRSEVILATLLDPHSQVRGPRAAVASAAGIVRGPARSFAGRVLGRARRSTVLDDAMVTFQLAGSCVESLSATWRRSR
jgi:glycosyltransferase involved in cell wall biosynthesis